MDDHETPPLARPPRRLFRLGRLEDPLAPLAGPPEDVFGGAVVLLWTTRRGAILDAVAAGALAETAGWGVASYRLADPRPVLDRRQQVVEAAATGELAAAFAAAVGGGYAGVAFRGARAPTQTGWALSREASLTLLDGPRPISRHDPDVAAVRRLRETG